VSGGIYNQPFLGIKAGQVYFQRLPSLRKFPADLMNYLRQRVEFTVYSVIGRLPGDIKKKELLLNGLPKPSGRCFVLHIRIIENTGTREAG
jgi:hypothetical protein